mmetsp:Transcript_64291/g.102372  ORF Transcript_64291/g.102372 Transcript_64291/m.102372 type:complete len:161 (+) Transcript_64291:2-484(+)
MLLSKEELNALTVGSKLDVRDDFGRFLQAQIIETDEFKPHRVKVHFIGWSAVWDKWMEIDVRSDGYQLITHLGNITERDIRKEQIRDIGIGDTVIIKLPSYHKHHGVGWISAKIIDMDKGQLNVQYKLSDDEDAGAFSGNRENSDIHEFWVHADNLNECR